jgi:hypothetical protein
MLSFRCLNLERVSLGCNNITGLRPVQRLRPRRTLLKVVVPPAAQTRTMSVRAYVTSSDRIVPRSKEPLGTTIRLLAVWGILDEILEGGK